MTPSAARWPLAPDVIADAYVAACRLEVRTLKPGNVHIHAGGHGMTVEDFERSAMASAPYIADPQMFVGEKIRAAVATTLEAVGTNTNLGIILLSAPLAAAAGPRARGDSLPERLTHILETLDHRDSREAFRAIAQAKPAGLGAAATGDVTSEPPPHLNLLEAMRLAADRDLIAAQYAHTYRDVFRLTEAFERERTAGLTAEAALAKVFLTEMAAQPDTHVARKYGRPVAENLRARAQARLERLGDLRDPYRLDIFSDLIAFDAELKAEGLNPGALADLMAAAAFAARLRQSGGG